MAIHNFPSHNTLAFSPENWKRLYQFTLEAPKPHFNYEQTKKYTFNQFKHLETFGSWPPVGHKPFPTVPLIEELRYLDEQVYEENMNTNYTRFFSE